MKYRQLSDCGIQQGKKNKLFNEENICRVNQGYYNFYDHFKVKSEGVTPTPENVKPAVWKSTVLRAAMYRPGHLTEVKEALAETIDPVTIVQKKGKQETFVTPREENPRGARNRNKPIRWIERISYQKYAGRR